MSPSLPRPSFLPLRHFNQLQSGRWGRIARNGPWLNANTHSPPAHFSDLRGPSIIPILFLRTSASALFRSKTIFVFRLSSSECQVTNETTSLRGTGKGEGGKKRNAILMIVLRLYSFSCPALSAPFHATNDPPKKHPNLGEGEGEREWE